MDIVAYICAGMFFIGFMVTGIYLLVCAFRRHILWGLGYMFIPFVGLIYIIVDWRNVWKAVLIHFCCMPLMILSMFLSPKFVAEMNKKADSAETTTVDQDDQSSDESASDSSSSKSKSKSKSKN